MAKRFDNKTKSRSGRFLHEARRLDLVKNKNSADKFGLSKGEQQQQEAKCLEVNWFTLAANSWDWFMQRGRGFMSVEVLREEPDDNGVLVKAHYFSRSDLEKISGSSHQIDYFLKAIDTYDPFTQILVLLNLPHSQFVNINCFTPPLIPSECWQQFKYKENQGKRGFQ